MMRALALLLVCVLAAVRGDSSLSVAFADDFPPTVRSQLLELLSPFSPLVVPFSATVTSGAFFLVFGGRERPDCGLSFATAPEIFQVCLPISDAATY
jgi:hypothetical protein